MAICSTRCPEAPKPVKPRACPFSRRHRRKARKPTAPAHSALGDLAKQRGELPLAVAHYKVAAQSGGAYGEAAAAEAARLMPDIPDVRKMNGVLLSENGRSADALGDHEQ